MKKVLLTATALVSLGAASFAMAGSVEQPAHQDSKGGLYVGVGAGWGALTTPSDFYNSGLNSSLTSSFQKENGFAGRVNLGYLFSVSNNVLLGLETGYIYLPETTNTLVTNANPSQTLKQEYNPRYVLDLLGVAKVYVTNQINLFGKAGLAYVSQEYTTSVVTAGNGALVSSYSTKQKVLPEVAVGAGYNITDNLEANITYAHAFGSENNAQITDLTSATPISNKNVIPSFNTVMAGLNYTFSL
ncbi:MAG: hypothetical protein A3F10_02185 [Coxiella sp. RIFCSPHIGHO2_12_FULL_42_15]|nr:MAG: hypothetical protein A3F10_02185 [Coxiella sp. RIFCSPHIGHO2_12_FULL_42_15]